MFLRVHTPAAPLDQYVGSFTFYSGYNPEHSIEKLLPDASVNLIIELDEIPRYTFEKESLKPASKCINAWISGMQTSFVCYSAVRQSRMFVIQFNGGGSFPFVHIPLVELNNLIIDAELIFGDDILFLREQLLHADSHIAMFTMVEQWLLNRARQVSLPESVIDFAVGQISTQPTLATLKMLSEKTGYSQKQFIHLFKKYVGITPKKFQRIVRFNKALLEIEKFNHIDWLSISYDCGFYDQAHFINEFRAFADMNPTEYLVQKGEYRNYLPVFTEK